MKSYKFISYCVFMLLLSSCTAAQHHNQLHSTAENKLTVGKVQKFIKKGMSSTEVAEIMGSPNIVTSAGTNGEAWIYDKFATEASYSKSSQGADIMVLGLGPVGDALMGGSGGLGVSAKTGASSQSQRTLTVIINFVDNKVSDFKYHSSSF